MVQLRIDPKYKGVTLVQMESLLAESDEPLEVLWENSRRERALFRRCRDRDITLIVRSLSVMERSAASLGLRYAVTGDLFNTSVDCLASPSTDWRELTKRIGHGVSRSLLVAMAAHGLRTGVDHAATRKVALESLFNNVSPQEADNLVALRMQGARR